VTYWDPVTKTERQNVYERHGITEIHTPEEREYALVFLCTIRNVGQTCLVCQVTYASEYGHQRRRLEATKRRLDCAEARIKELEGD